MCHLWLLSFQKMNRENVCPGDPLLVAIENFRAGLKDYNDNAPLHTDEAANAYAAVSYREPLRVIEEWKQPAITREAAIAALKLAIDADNDGDYALVGPLVMAALGYFEATP
jgi:hypothetical protein